MTPEQVALALSEDINFNNGLILEYNYADVLDALRLIQKQGKLLDIPDDTNDPNFLNLIMKIKTKFQDEVRDKGFGTEVEKRPFKALKGNPLDPHDRLVNIMLSIDMERKASMVKTPSGPQQPGSKAFDRPRAKQWAASQSADRSTDRLDTKLDQQP